MYGISSSGKESISSHIDKMFDILAYKLLGRIPKLQNKPHLFDIFGGITLASIFVQALNNRDPNQFERDALRSILTSSHGYIESLKNKTSSNVVEGIDALVKEAKAKGTHVTKEQVNEIFSAEMTKAKGHMKLIAEAETTKTRNVGHTMEIASKAKDMGVSDPNVFFVIVRDGQVCSECVRLHMMPDGVTPKVYKMSELSMGWHKRGDDRPSACGEHPHCRCVYDGNSPVITERGTIPLKKVVVGDRVLTHTGKFKKVLGTFGEKGIAVPVEDMYRIEFIDPKGKTRKLRVTKDHLMLTQRGWVRADELDISKDTLKFLFKECENCKQPFAHDIDKKHKRYCSHKCADAVNLPKAIAAIKGKKQSASTIEKRAKSISKTISHKNKGRREDVRVLVCKECNVSFTHSMAYTNDGIKWVYGEEPNFCSRSCSSSNTARKQWEDPKHKENVSNKNRISMKRQYETGERSPEIVRIARAVLCKNGGGPSRDQILLYNLVKEVYSDAVMELPIDRYFADIAIPSINTVIEWDGGGHWMSVFKGLKTMGQKKNEDMSRDAKLNSLGWHVLRYNPETGFKNVLGDVRRVSLNSTDGYSFNDVVISNIAIVDSSLVSRTARLYDITVEDDASFVIMGVISHNCSLSQLPPGWGFKNGYISFISLDYDAWKDQRGEG